MNKTDYNSQADLIVDIIDIAIDCFINQSPENLEPRDIKQMVDVYQEYRNRITDPDLRPKTIAPLKQMLSDVLTYFQESSGKAVNAFWRKIDAKSLNIKRVDRFAKILDRGKIKNHIEYDIIIDLYTPYLQENKLSKEQIEKINELILDFERRKS